jgi:hypothetical protein
MRDINAAINEDGELVDSSSEQVRSGLLMACLEHRSSSLCSSSGLQCWWWVDGQWQKKQK